MKISDQIFKRPSKQINMFVHSISLEMKKKQNQLHQRINKQYICLNYSFAVHYISYQSQEATSVSVKYPLNIYIVYTRLDKCECEQIIRQSE